MIRHIVIIHFKKTDIDYFNLLEKTRPLVEQIPGIIRYELFRNESQYVPKNVSSVGVEILFKDWKSLEGFMKHPKHYEANAIFEKYLSDPPYMVLTHEV